MSQQHLYEHSSQSAQAQQLSQALTPVQQQRNAPASARAVVADDHAMPMSMPWGTTSSEMSDEEWEEELNQRRLKLLQPSGMICELAREPAGTDYEPSAYCGVYDGRTSDNWSHEICNVRVFGPGQMYLHLAPTSGNLHEGTDFYSCFHDVGAPLAARFLETINLDLADALDDIEATPDEVNMVCCMVLEAYMEVVAEEDPDAYTTKLEDIDSEMRLPSEHFSFDEADSFLEGCRRPLPSSEMELLLKSHEDVVRRNHRADRRWAPLPPLDSIIFPQSFLGNNVAHDYFKLLNSFDLCKTSYHFGNLWGTTEIKATVGTGFVNDDYKEEEEEEEED